MKYTIIYWNLLARDSQSQACLSPACFRVWGSGFSGYGFWVLGFRVLGLRFNFLGLGFAGLQGLRFWVEDFG